MTIVRASAVVFVALFAGCGGCGSDSKTPDAFIIHDMGIDARVCETATPGMLDFLGYDAENGILEWGGPITAAGLGTNMTYQFEFYDNIEATLMGTFDLTAGNQANYATCALCIHGFERDDQGKTVKEYFQSAGSITLTEDPFTNKRLVGSVTDLQLEEVTIGQGAMSTPVPGGKCGNVATYSVDHDRVPNAWTCQHADYDTTTSCNCVCGTPDPDCIINNTPVVGCTTGQACFNDACVAPPANDTCALATALTLGTPVTATTAGAQRNYDAGLEVAACTGYPGGQPGPDVVYSIDLTASQAITVTLSGLAADYDGSIALIGPGAATLCDANPIATCVAGADDKLNGQDETFTYTATTAGTYYVIVDSWNPYVGGSFTLTVN